MIHFVFLAILFIIGYSYVGYPAVLFLITHRKNAPVPPHQGVFPSITLITAAYNEAGVIRGKIANLKRIDYPPDKFSALIGSDGSTDGTVHRGRAAAGCESDIEVVDFAERRGKAAVLNDLVRRSRSEVVVLSDANTELDSKAVANLVRWFSDPDVGCVCGRLDLLAGTEGGRIEQTYWRFETRLKQMENKLGAVLGANGGIYAFRRTAYKPIANNTITDDFVLPMLIRQQGYRIVFDAAAVARENTAPLIQHEFKRRIRIGAGNLQALLRTRALLRPRAGWTAFAYWSHKVSRWIAAPLALLTIPLSLIQISHPFYGAVVATWGIVAGSALIGWLLERAGNNSGGIIGLCYAATAMNIALLIGAIRFLVGAAGGGSWAPTPRNVQ